jgi:hypothetical protein
VKNIIAGLVVVVGLVAGFSVGTTGCTSAEVKQAEADLVKVLQKADDALAALADNPALLDDADLALSALAAVAPQTGPVHDAIVRAQAAIVALKEHKSTIAQAQSYLQVVINLLESNGKVPAGAVRHKLTLKKP